MSSRAPHVSVIMSEYATDSSVFAAALESILSQTFRDFELVIVDDSQDGRLPKLLQPYGSDARIRPISNGGNKGFVPSLNAAIAHARGKYLVRMDTDDIAYPERFAHQYDFMESHLEYSVVGALALEFTEDQEQGILGKSGEKTAKDVMRGNSLVHPSVMMRRADIMDAGGYADYHRAEDLALWLELLHRGKRLFVMDEVLLRYRVNPEDYSKRVLKNRRGEIAARWHYYPKLGAGPLEYGRIIYTITAGLLPPPFVRWYRKHFVLKGKSVEENEGA